MSLTPEQKDEAASRIARAITNAVNQTGEIPTEAEIKEAARYVLDSIVAG